VLGRRRFVDNDFPAFAFFIEHTQHADTILILVILGFELLRCKPVDQTDAESRTSLP
jgi:hypothetical protein